MKPEVGGLVRVRSRQYLVEDVVPPPNPTDQTLVRLSCLDDDAQGVHLEVLWEKEVDAAVASEPTWHHAAERGFDPLDRFSAYLHALRWNLVTSTNPKLFQAPYRAGIKVEAYQLEPLRKALLLPRVSLFIADDVGLGKTIEAGLILQELLLRQRVRRAVVACPPSVVLQWRDEMERRFGLGFVVLDREYVATKRRERGIGVNPWTTHSRFIVSHALLRDEDYANGLRDWLGDFAPASLLILDEAHNAAPASGAKYAIDSHFTRAVRDLAPRFEHRLFLSATPHNGHSNSFSALLELLDPQRFCRGVPVKSAKLLDAVMVRRLKEDLRQLAGGFPIRRIVQHDIDGLPADAPELRLSIMLARLQELRDERLRAATRSVQSAAGLVITSLQKRLLSSIEAFACTLAVHRRALARQLTTLEPLPAPDSTAQLLLEAPGPDDERGALSDDELEAEEKVAMDRATAASAGGERNLIERELALVDEMVLVAEAARGLPDPKVSDLVNWLRENLCPGLPLLGTAAIDEPAPTWTDRRLIIFTEYTDTKRYLEQQLTSAIALTDGAEQRIGSFTGGMGEESRESVKQAFNTDPRKHPLRILLATDAAREGVNLQNHCADLFHFDLPWNPGRLEQRNGRIDRKLQRAPEVRCHYFVFRQRPEDRVLETLVAKTERITKELGSLSPVLDRQLERLLSRGIRAGQEIELKRRIQQAEADPEERATVEEELEASRQAKQDLSRQLDGLRDLLQAAQEHLQYNEDGLRNALNSSLELLKAPPLKLVSGSDGRESWTFPELDRRAGADATWGDTLDTLRAPRRPDQKLWEWRREAPIRPVVFEDPGSLDADVVHLHLEQRVVKRLLGRFLAQGFVHDDISRACVGQITDAIPRVVLLGRLSLYGDGATRLHDEIIAVAARWTDSAARTQPLRPFADEAREKALELLEATLINPRLQSVPKSVLQTLLHGIEGDVKELRPHLITRGEQRAAWAEDRLRARGEKEAQDMEQILTGQRDRIRATQTRWDNPQLLLDFDPDSRRQLEADKRYWARRLESLEGELQREPARIFAGYAVRARRIEPIGVAYLWPVSG